MEWKLVFFMGIIGAVIVAGGFIYYNQGKEIEVGEIGQNIIDRITSSVIYLGSNVGIGYTPPTPGADSSQDEDAIFINVSTANLTAEHYTYVDLNNDTIVWFRFDANTSVGESATVVLDWSGNGRNGTITDTIDVTLVNDSRFGGMVNFSGELESVSFGSDVILNFSRNWTISAWVNQTILGGPNIYANLHNTNAADNFIFLIDDGTRGEVGYGIGSTYNRQTGDIGFQLGVLNHIVLTYDGGGFDNDTAYHLYINGTEFSTSDGPTFPEFTNDNIIGTADDNDIEGNVDEFIVIDRNLSAVEVRALYDATATQYFHNFTNLPDGNYTFTAQAIQSSGDLFSDQRNIQIPSVEADTCTYVSDNWAVMCSDDCVISEDVTVDTGGNITILGTGTFTVNEGVNITGFNRLQTDRTCFVQTNGQGGFFQF